MSSLEMCCPDHVCLLKGNAVIPFKNEQKRRKIFIMSLNRRALLLNIW